MKAGESNSKEEKTKFTKAIIKGYIPLSNFSSLLFYLHSNHLINIVPYFDIEESLRNNSENNVDNPP